MVLLRKYLCFRCEFATLEGTRVECTAPGQGGNRAVSSLGDVLARTVCNSANGVQRSLRTWLHTKRC